MKANIPNIVKINDIYADDTKLYIVMERLKELSLFDQVVLKKNRYTEKNWVPIMKKLLQAVSKLHKLGVLHLKIRLEHVLFDVKDEPKLISFSLFPTQTLFKIKAARPSELYWVPPEMLLEGEYMPSSDVWSFGVLLYLMIAGYRPFSAENRDDLIKAHNNGKLQFHSKEWGKISLDWKNLIKSMVLTTPSSRIKLSRVLINPWVLELDYENIGNTTLNDSISFKQKFAKGQKHSGFKNLKNEVVISKKKPDTSHSSNKNSPKADKSKFGGLEETEKSKFEEEKNLESSVNEF